MKLVVIESPYAGDIDKNIAYARACMCDSLLRGEAPIASHLLYTQDGILRDDDKADLVAIYTDLGISPGMGKALNRAERSGRPFEFRSLLVQT